MNRLNAVAAVLALAGCASIKSEPMAGPLQLNDHQRQGEKVFFRHCNECHPQGQAGLAPSLNDKPLPDFLIKKQVRHPFFWMPEFDRSTISQDDLAALTDYMHALEKAPARR